MLNIFFIERFLHVEQFVVEEIVLMLSYWHERFFFYLFCSKFRFLYVSVWNKWYKMHLFHSGFLSDVIITPFELIY